VPVLVVPAMPIVPMQLSGAVGASANASAHAIAHGAKGARARVPLPGHIENACTTCVHLICTCSSIL
jgi:hypothetical protein